jgi:hypothetical protein
VTKPTVTLIQTIVRHVVGIAKALEEWARSLVVSN